MRETFGSVWTTQYGAVPNDTWLRGLADVTDEQLVRGLNRMIRERAEFPPNLTQFIALCTQADPQPEISPSYHKALPLDPPETEEHRAARKARGAERMAEVKAASKGRV
jgi:hypothetical protein